MIPKPHLRPKTSEPPHEHTRIRADARMALRLGFRVYGRVGAEKQGFGALGFKIRMALVLGLMGACGLWV